MMPEQLNKQAFSRFIHWITERHNIYLRRQAGHDKPWTTDPVLQQYFFTNPYRENDKVTVWFREHIRDPLSQDYINGGKLSCPKPILPFAVVAFRWFNYIPTGSVLLHNGLFSDWDVGLATKLLHEREDQGRQIFTGAYMIKIENGRSKIDSCCDQISKLWDRRDAFWSALKACTTLEDGWKQITLIPYIGPFMAYEVITDLRHTTMFNQAPDIMTWCNLGPGAIRGLFRLTHPDGVVPPMKGSSSPKNVMQVMRPLLALVNEDLSRRRIPSLDTDSTHVAGQVTLGEHAYPQFEMRDLEHSLCEFDKYERARLGQGTMKRRYNGT